MLVQGLVFLPVASSVYARGFSVHAAKSDVLRGLGPWDPVPVPEVLQRWRGT